MNAMMNTVTTKWYFPIAITPWAPILNGIVYLFHLKGTAEVICLVTMAVLTLVQATCLVFLIRAFYVWRRDVYLPEMARMKAFLESKKTTFDPLVAAIKREREELKWPSS
jgi:hypothetical protein